MAHVISLPDGSNRTILSEKDFHDLVEERMGPEARDYLSEIIEETVQLSLESAEESYEELKSKYEVLKEEYKHLEDQFDDLRYERGCW